MSEVLHLIGRNQLIAACMALAVWSFSMTPFLRRRPALRHGLWLLVLLKSVTPQVVSVELPEFHGVESLAASDAVPAQSPSARIATAQSDASPAVENWNPSSAACCNPSILATAVNVPPTASESVKTTSLPGDSSMTSQQDIGLACVIVSVSVTAVFWMIVLSQFIRTRGLILRQSTDSGHVAELLQEVASRFNMRSTIPLKIVDAPIAPMLWAWPGRAAILLPRGLARSLDDEPLRSIIAHELAHLVRRDHWTNLFSLCVASLFWWNPIVWFARRRLLSASEACCDALALERLAGSRKTYAATLLAVVDSLKAAPRPLPAIGMTFGGSQALRKRFELLADERVRARTSRGGWLVLCLAMTGSQFIPMQAEEPDPRASFNDATKWPATYCCPEPLQTKATVSGKISGKAAVDPTPADQSAASGTQPDLSWDIGPKLERLTRSSRTFSTVGYIAESRSWKELVPLTKSQSAAILALDELVWDTRQIQWIELQKRAKSPKSRFDPKTLWDPFSGEQRRSRESQAAVLGHAEQMLKLGMLTPGQSSFVTQRQVSQNTIGRLLYDPYLQKQIGLDLSVGEANDLKSRGLMAVPDVLSAESQARLAELMVEKSPPAGPPDLPTPTDEELEQILLPPFFQRFEDQRMTRDLSAEQLKALRDLQHLTRLGLFWNDHRADADADAATVRKEFLEHVQQILRRGILTPAQDLGFFGISC